MSGVSRMNGNENVNQTPTGQDEKPTKAEGYGAKEQTLANEDDIKLAIGEFVMAFSQLEFTIRDALSRALSLDDALFDIVVGPYDFVMLCTVSKEVFELKLDKETSEELEKILSKCHTLNATKRLPIAHGTWFYQGGVRHVSRQTLEDRFLFENIKELRKTATDARRLMGLLTEAFYKPSRAVSEQV
jgi:hypothetical protein